MTKTEKLKKSLFDGFVAIQKLKGIPNKTKHRMLWEMFFCNGENTLFWEVIGITEMAGRKIKENNYKLPKGVKENKVNRSHIYPRIRNQRDNVGKNRLDYGRVVEILQKERQVCVGNRNRKYVKRKRNYQIPSSTRKGPFSIFWFFV